VVRIGTFPNSGLRVKLFGMLAPRAGLEPATLRLTAECSTIELPRNVGHTARIMFGRMFNYITHTKNLSQRSASSRWSAIGSRVAESISPDLQTIASRSRSGTGTYNSRTLAVMGTALKFTAGVERYPPGGEKTLKLSFLLRPFPQTYPSRL
jgi:hypothetical protein